MFGLGNRNGGILGLVIGVVFVGVGIWRFSDADSGFTTWIWIVVGVLLALQGVMALLKSRNAGPGPSDPPGASGQGGA